MLAGDAENYILIVEDDLGLAELVQYALEGVGCTLKHAPNGAVALQCVIQKRPLLLLLDYSLPDMNSRALLERIASALGRVPPFVVTTGVGDERIAVEMMKHGARDYLVKDRNFLELLPGVVTRVLRETATETKLVDAEMALRQSEERYRSVVEDQTEAIYRLLPDITLTFVNRSICYLLGKQREELLGQSFLDYVEQKNRLEIRENLEKITLENPTYSTIQSVVLSDGSERIIEWTTRGLFDSNGGLLEYQGIGRDVTEHRRVEEQLLQAQKMEAIGTLAGGIAHDFNNLLTGILGHAEILMKELPPGSSACNAAKTIEKAAERAAELTSQLLGFARRGKFLMLPVNVHSVITETVALLSRTFDKNIQIVEGLNAGDASVIGDPGQIQQLLLNLAINGRDAMPEGGILTLRADVVQVDDDYCRAHPTEVPGWYVTISVHDTGCGISKEVQGRIFEPFFTTKEPGRGTGMGLAMVYGIVKNHGGFVTVNSEEGEGAVFTVYLPLHSNGSIVERPQVEEKPDMGVGRIMVVDDEPVVREIAQTMLLMMGYEAVTFEDGKDAISYYAAHFAEIDLIILDMVMPVMNGRECFRQMRKINPDVCAILSSGYGLDGKAQETLNEGMVGFIQKPYKMAELGDIVSSVLKKPVAM